MINFEVNAARMASWCNDVLCTNLTYFRSRRQLFESLIQLMSQVSVQPTVRLSDEQFIVIKAALTVRNEGLSDDKRLALDKSILEIKSMCSSAIIASSASGSGGGT